MRPPAFEYLRAGSAEEAVTLLAGHPGAKILAGGHSLLPAMSLRLADPGLVIDIGRVREWRGITDLPDGSVRIGALTTHAEIARSPLVPAVMTDAAAHIGDPQVRNRGTIGGNLAHADPASDWPTVITALNATIEVVGPRGPRSIGALDCFTGLFETAVAEDEILTGVLVPALPAGSGSAYAKLPHPASRYAVVGAAAVVGVSGGQCRSAGIAVGGLTTKATRTFAVESALAGRPLGAETFADAAATVLEDLGDEVIGDAYASGAYRRAMAVVFVRRALTSAAERAA